MSVYVIKCIYLSDNVRREIVKSKNLDYGCQHR